MKIIDCDNAAYDMLSEAAEMLISVTRDVERQLHGGPLKPGACGSVIVEQRSSDGDVDCWTITIAFQGTKPGGTSH